MKKVPSKFTLNKGHAYFFYNKGKYLHNRFNSLKLEMKKRNFSPNNDFPRNLWPDHLYNDWTPNSTDLAIIRERINLRISQKPHLYRKTPTKSSKICQCI